jgi:hypothetical protein
MQCKVTMQRPDGSRARHVGHYPNPGMAMDVVQAMHPDCSVNSAVATDRPTDSPSGGPSRSCDDLGVCQSTVRTCGPNEVCARKNSPFYFAPGVINGGSTDLQLDSNDYIIDFTWTDFAAGMVIMAIIMAISGWLL